MLGAGVSLERALQSLEQSAPDRRLRAVRPKMKDGNSAARIDQFKREGRL